MARAHTAEATHTVDDGGKPGFLSRYAGRTRRPGGSRWGGREMWRRGWVLAVLALLLGLAFILHSEVPNSIGNVGSLWETFLPWGGLLIIGLLGLALLRRAPVALLALLLPALVWVNLFGGSINDKSGSGGDITVLTHNVNADNPDPTGTARSLAHSGAGIIALEEVTGQQAGTYRKGLASSHPHHKLLGTVGLWSKYPMKDIRPVDIKMGWPRAMRATVETPKGEIAVYAAHLPSVRVQFRAGFTAGQRDGSAQALGDAIEKDKADRAVLLGDLNGTMNDRALAPITSQMRSAQGAAGSGFGFSWPASFPMARIDQIMVKGATPVSAWTLPSTGSDHLPVAAQVNLTD
ncbi:endonuclease/exonuclease/phosphatase family protein [Streptomyces sp. NBC_01795]|nr:MULTISPECIES: endonuclease/exonuclease/phosphatase family protein [unclassified Streptomyces]WSA95136.1 endonuclease/exonuclease/phosphatase family protein [Streptomyces sp. NBC_01795]WSB79558.1 endonuclease/exonuclease/phosphatase family protein [Streptomyces sp. NBC_01775]WSS12239.1 endonuclease/exonuclease/phosphatase family protein [Streptomyces sp. NBC_01186]WSS40952.1 endonuclease/exonuclease/phosphatase family protein [Streptomyces sp. NBC_01187]